MPKVAIIDRVADDAVIWHVNTDLAANPYVGAWVLASTDERLRLLLCDPWFVATSEGRSILELVAPREAEEVDLKRLHVEVLREQARLQALFESEQAQKKNKLVAPEWPVVPAAPDVDDPRPRVLAPDLRVERALTIARWLGQISSVWDTTEVERLRREWGRKDSGAERRPLPLAAVQANSDESDQAQRDDRHL